MVRRRFGQASLPGVLAFFLAVGLPPLARSQGTNITVPAAPETPITYTFTSYESLQNGYTLRGTITTDGVLGPLAGTDIIAWTWTITNGINTDTQSGTSLSYPSNSLGLMASSTQLLVSGTSGEVVFQGPPSTYLEYAPSLGAYDAAILGGIRAWNSPTNHNSLGGDPWVIASVGKQCVTPSSGIVGWWPGDGNSNDIIGGNNGTAVGGVTFAPGKVGQAFSLDGSSGYVNVIDSSGTLSISGPLTLDAWVQLNKLDKFQYIMIKDSGTCSGAFHNYQLFVTNTNKVDFAVGDGTNVYELQSGSQLTTGTWYHIAAVYDGNNQFIYINGVRDASVTIGSKRLHTNPSYPLHIGAAIESCAFYPLAGLIDELEIFNRALTASEIQAIFDAGTAGKCKEAPVAATGATFGTTEGVTFTGTIATFTDPDPASSAAQYSATIDWGDTTPKTPGTISGTGGPFTVSGTHTYAEQGTYTVTIVITDIDTPLNTATAHSTARVSDGRLLSTCPTMPVSTQTYTGVTAIFTDQSSTGTLSDFSATIAWGDSSSSPGAITGGPGSAPYTVSGTHTYASTGTFLITTTIADIGGSTTTTPACPILVFGTSAGGNFVIGDGNSEVGTRVTFWGAQWWKLNTLSGGPAPASFKGFEDVPGRLPACGANWSTDPGNSTPPPANPLPAFMAVIVSSSISKSGTMISGDTPGVVVVQTDPGYAPNPGHAGTGKVVAEVCHVSSGF